MERQSLRSRHARAEMEHAAKEFGIELWEHVGNVIQAMRRIAPRAGIGRKFTKTVGLT